MTVKRIVPNISAKSLDEVKKFYTELFDLEIVMDLDWIVTLASEETGKTQISLATQGGSDTDTPDLSIEVDNVDFIYERAKNLGYNITYELTNEPWGVRRFYLLDPTGKTLNVLSHTN